MSLLLGIDLGTSSVKTVLFNPQTTQIQATASQEYPLYKPLPHYAEQNPTEWWQAVVATVRHVAQKAENNQITAISFSGQMHGTVLLDKHQQSLCPAIIWADQRSVEACRTLTTILGATNYVAVTGTLPVVGFMGPTLVWLTQHQPDLLPQIRHVILPKDYIRLRMTGQIATDVSDAAGTGVFDIVQQQWATSIISALDLPLDIFPPVLASTAVAGYLTRAAAHKLGLPVGIPIITGCADQPAQAICNGLIAPGKASVTVGSGGQIFSPVQLDHSFKQTDPRLHVFNHAVPNVAYILGAILSAGLSLRWLRNITGLAQNSNAYTLLSTEAATVKPGADGLIFLPYLSGERTPHMDPLARGGFIGLTQYHTRPHLARAVMEGVAFALRQALEIILALGGDVAMLIAAGGASESEVWRQIQADIFGLPLRQSLLTEQAGVGAALLAGVGVGLYPNLSTACQQVVQYGPLTEPNTAPQAQYTERYEQFKQLYPRLRSDFHRLGGELSYQ